MTQNQKIDYTKYLKTGFFNVGLAEDIGLKPAILFSALAKSVEHPDENDGWECYSINFTESYTTFSEKEQIEIIKKLEDLEMIETQLQGAPEKKYFRIKKNADKQK